MFFVGLLGGKSVALHICMRKDDRKTRVNNISLKEAREIIGKSNVKKKEDK